MRGPAITLPEPAASKLAELTLARDAALDAGRSAQTRATICLLPDSGHAAAPPRSVMNSRRFIRLSRRRGRAASTAP